MIYKIKSKILNTDSQRATIVDEKGKILYTVHRPPSIFSREVLLDNVMYIYHGGSMKTAAKLDQKMLALFPKIQVFIENKFFGDFKLSMRGSIIKSKNGLYKANAKIFTPKAKILLDGNHIANIKTSIFKIRHEYTVEMLTDDDPLPIFCLIMCENMLDAGSLEG